MVAPGSKVLVSGANGFIAIYVVQRLLQEGYAVRGTVRSSSKGEHLKKVFAEYGDKFEIAVVEDIAKVSKLPLSLFHSTDVLTFEHPKTSLGLLMKR